MPVEPVPKRVVPETITYPDYAKNCEALLAIPEKWKGVPGGAVAGKTEEVWKTIKWGLGEVSSEADFSSSEPRS